MLYYYCSKGKKPQRTKEKKFLKTLDIKHKTCYNEYTKGQGKVLKTRRELIMTKNSLSIIYATLSSIEFENKEAVMSELSKEIHRGEAERAAKNALYEAAKDVVISTLSDTPVTVAEIYESCKDELPHGFTKNQISYGLSHYWTDAVIKIEGKVNSYRRA